MTSLICGILNISLGTSRVWDRSVIGEWEKAARKAGIRFGLTFHHEYSWWWQTAFQSDTKGDKKGVPYDGNLTLADGKGK